MAEIRLKLPPETSSPSWRTLPGRALVGRTSKASNETSISESDRFEIRGPNFLKNMMVINYNAIQGL